MQLSCQEYNPSYVELNSGELTQLENWATNEKGKARAFARNVLEAYYDNNTFCDCIDRMQNKSSFDNNDVSSREKESPLSIEASPNPATHYVEFSYELSEIDKDGIIIITDINGKQIQSFNTKYTKGKKAWDIRKIPSGSYIVTLKTQYFEKSAKLIIR